MIIYTENHVMSERCNKLLTVEWQEDNFLFEMLNGSITGPGYQYLRNNYKITHARASPGIGAGI